METQIRALVARRALMTKKQFRQQLLHLMSRGVEMAKAFATVRGSAENLVAATWMENLYEALKSNNRTEIARLDRIGKAKGGVVFLR